MEHIFIIAEAGVNHNGDSAIAKQMVDAAVEAGADAIKFQTFQAKHIASQFAPKTDYQEKTTNTEENQLDMLQRLELSLETHQELLAYCKNNGMMFLSTPFDLESIDLLHKLDVQMFKIPSGEITNLPYLQKIGRLKKQLILSTGMANLGEIEAVLNILTAAGTLKEQITVLHCNTEYPTPISDVNLRAMQTIQHAFHVKVGYSDHTLGIEVPIAAAALGASIIEKHFTLDRNMIGPDHAASLEPDELRAMVTAIRNIECALGNGIKRPSSSESKNIPIVRKSLVASRLIQQGDLLTAENMTAKRPGTGISPMQWEQIVGRRAVRDFGENELIEI